MDIPPDFRPADPVARRRLLEGGAAPGGRKPPVAPARGDDYVAPDTAAVKRWTAQAQTAATDPAKLAALRQALEDGSFTASPEELVDPLLDRLDPPRQG